MKKLTALSICLVALACVSLSSCGTSGRTAAHSNNAYHAPTTFISSMNDYALDVEPNGIS